MSYKKLEIWELAKALVVDIHHMTLETLYETGSLTERELFGSHGDGFNYIDESITQGDHACRE